MVAGTDTVIYLRLISLLFMLMLLFGCAKDQDSGISSKTDEGILKSLNADNETLITIGPLHAMKSSIVSLKTGDIKIETGSIRWTVNGITENTTEGHRFTSNSLRKGDVVQAAGTSNNKEYLSNKIVIRSTPPSITNAKLLPEFPSVKDTFTVSVNARDADNDRVFYSYKWYLNDDYKGDDSFLETEMKRGDMVSVEVTPLDGEDNGNSVRLERIIVNSLPVVNDSSHDFNGQTYTHRLDITDPDNDPLSYVLKKGPEAMTIDPAKGVLTWEVTPDDKGSHEIEVVVKDNHGAELIIPFTAMIEFR